MGNKVNQDVARVVGPALQTICPILNERDRRLVMGTFALAIGRGGNTFVRLATGASKNTVTAGSKEIFNYPSSKALMECELPDEQALLAAEDDDNTSDEHLAEAVQEREKAETQELDDAQSNADNDDVDCENAEDPGEDREKDVKDSTKNTVIMHRDPGYKELEKEKKEAEKLKREEAKRQREQEALANQKPWEQRIRAPGAGRKSILEKHPDILNRIEKIIDRSGQEYGDPMDPLKHTTLSQRDIADLLAKDPENPIKVSHKVVGRLLTVLGYSKQKNQKQMQVGKPHPDRDEQFKFINQKAKEFLDAGDPVISTDTKKKEKIGNFSNPGLEYRKVGAPRITWDHDFIIKLLGIAIPYGIYVVNNNTAFVNVGRTSDTPEFAGASLKIWLSHIGFATFPNSKRIYITCDGGGSNGSKVWLWKLALQEIADETGLEIHVSHYPPGTSKWNKIEHRCFCYISKNWAGQPLEDIETVVKLIGSTRTKGGLKVTCQEDRELYLVGKRATQEEKDSLNIEFIKVGDTEHWNYIIRPREDKMAQVIAP